MSRSIVDMSGIEVQFRFYGDLNDLLPLKNRQTEYTARVSLRASVKDAIESQSVPHTEVSRIQINGDSANWSRLLVENDRISVYPRGTSWILEADDPLGIPLVPPVRFVCDVHLGRLTRVLRLLGFDTWYANRDPGDSTLLSIAGEEARVLLTRDRKLLMNGGLKWGRVVRSTKVSEQVRDVYERFNLQGQVEPFTRCTVCNSLLRAPSQDELTIGLQRLNHIRDRTPFSEFSYCPGCERVYWPGSHWRKIRERYNDLISGFLLSADR